jgi:uncharacterized protein YgiM (DUF1202 family)
MTIDSLRALFATALIALSSSAWADSSAACRTSLRENGKVLESFRRFGLACHQYGLDAGVLHCVDGKCKELPRDPDAPADLPPELTSHSVLLGADAPPLRLDCNGIALPSCVLYRPTAEQAKATYLNGELMIAPGDGCLYTSQREGADHPLLRKFCWQSGAVRERAQPFSYVGLKTSTTVNLPLRSQPTDSADVVHVIKAGQFVEVLLANFPESAHHSWILVRDRVGIVGWVPVPSDGSNNCLSNSASIEGFCHRGS